METTNTTETKFLDNPFVQEHLARLDAESEEKKRLDKEFNEILYTNMPEGVYTPYDFLSFMYNYASTPEHDIGAIEQAQYGLGWVHYVARADLPESHLKNNLAAYMWLYASAKNGYKKAEALRDKVAKRLSKKDIAKVKRVVKARLLVKRDPDPYDS